MKYFHVTHSSNIPEIGVHGLQRSAAQCKTGDLYVVTRSMVPYALRHMSRRHGVRISEMVVVEVDLPRRWSISKKIVRAWRRGVWRVKVDILPCKIVEYSSTDW